MPQNKQKQIAKMLLQSKGMFINSHDCLK